MRRSAKIYPIEQMPFEPVSDYNKKALAFLMKNRMMKAASRKIAWGEKKSNKKWCCFMKEPISKSLIRVRDQSSIVDVKGNDIDLPTLALGSTAIDQPIKGSIKELRFQKTKEVIAIKRHALPKDRKSHNPTLTHKYLSKAVHM